MKTITLNFKEDYFIDKMMESEDCTEEKLEAVIKNVFISFLTDIECEKVNDGVNVDLPLNISLLKENIDVMEILKAPKDIINEARKTLSKLEEFNGNRNMGVEKSAKIIKIKRRE